MKNKKRITGNKYFLIITTLLVGIFLGYFIIPSGKTETPIHTGDSSAHQQISPPEEHVFTCSMHPQIRQSEDGLCPICGMELIPLEKNNTDTNPGAVQMSEYAMKLANVQTMTVGGENDISKKLRLNGKIAVDERMAYSQSTHIPGRIEQLFVNFTGEEVRRGAPLAKIYSPEMVTAQEELLQAYAIKESNPRLFEAAKQKLRNWKISENQIRRIIENQQASEQFTITADVNGIVTEKLAELGDYVARGTPLYEIADLSKVWVLFDIYESDMNWIEKGSTVEFSVAPIPGETFEGEIDFIDPMVNSESRISTARVVVNNEKGILKPGMYVTGMIENPIDENAKNKISIPKSAVLWTGKRSVVYIKVSEGEFRMQEVVLGPSLGDSYIIKKGLETGDEVVVNGAFSVDAAAQLAGKPSMMNQDVGPQIEQLPKEAQQNLTAFLKEYFQIKNALVSDNFTAAKEAVNALEKKIEAGQVSALEPEAEELWENHLQALEKELKSFAEAANIEDFRDIFLTFSETFIDMLGIFNPENGALYVLRCPMANNDQGGNWLSRSPEIKNPYYGSKMLTCGEVVKEIN